VAPRNVADVDPTGRALDSPKVSSDTGEQRAHLRCAKGNRSRGRPAGAHVSRPSVSRRDLNRKVEKTEVFWVFDLPNFRSFCSILLVDNRGGESERHAKRHPHVGLPHRRWAIEWIQRANMSLLGR